MTSSEFKTMLQALAAGWQQRDYATVVSYFAEDVRYADPLRYSFENRQDLQAFFEHDEGLEQSTVWHNVIFDEAQQVGVVEYTYDGAWCYHGTVWIRVQDGPDGWRRLRIGASISTPTRANGKTLLVAPPSDYPPKKTRRINQ
ncbi:MAG: nuclear transport factor 2 family protein [Acidobacteria bacterium]|nr:nuclear transport factor 2 family protein [Acidobacteriota bacterium]MBI3425822.1 nuclear transport factor 2 family protein [Acidobacteriota bacterium]